MQTKTYIITETTDGDGKITLRRQNKGFSIIEILGIMNLITTENVAMMNGKPYDIIERIVEAEKDKDK